MTQFQAICPSPGLQVGGTLDMGAGHLHPLSYALGLARAAADRRCADSLRIPSCTTFRRGARAVVRTDHGQVEADHVILACNGYLGGLEAPRWPPGSCRSTISSPRPSRWAMMRSKVLTRDIAVADTKFVINYFRLSP